jgi:hypothetical protein
MTCEEWEQIQLDSSHYSSGEGWMLRASRAALVQEHVQNCPVCAKKLAEIAKMQDALDQLRVSTMHMHAPAAVERQVLDAFRQEAAKRHPSVGRTFLWRLVWASFAVFVLTVAGILFYSMLRPNSVAKVEGNGKGREVVEIQPSFSPGVSSVAVQALDENRRSAAKNPATTSRRHDAKAGRTAPERVVQRSPIPVNDELSLNGGGSIVRVTLPLSSLTAMGLPVHPDLSDPRVTADVWMDPFGAVVRIRLVAENASAN